MNQIVNYETQTGVGITRCKLRKDIVMVGSHFCGRCSNYLDHDNPTPYTPMGWVLCKNEEIVD